MGLFPEVGEGPRIPFKTTLPAGFSEARSVIYSNQMLRGGISRAGRALMKHPNMVGSTTGSEVLQRFGNYDGVNEATINVIKYIIKNGSRTTKTTLNFGRVVDYKLADGLGVRFSSTNRFIGFLGR